jgi:hypothetical protein
VARVAAPDKCPYHGGTKLKGAATRATKPARKPAGSRNGAGKLDAMLTAEKERVTRLREELARAEVRVGVLMELAGV